MEQVRCGKQQRQTFHHLIWEGVRDENARPDVDNNNGRVWLTLLEDAHPQGIGMRIADVR